MQAASLVTACGGPHVGQQVIGCTDAAEHGCASSGAAVGACIAGLIATPAVSLVTCCTYAAERYCASSDATVDARFIGLFVPV